MEPMHIARYGASYYAKGATAELSQRDGDLYAYQVLIGKQGAVELPRGSSMITFAADGSAVWKPGGHDHWSQWHRFAVILPGYQCGHKSVSLDQNSNLPYVNGCNTRQLFPPERIGDPTLQQLTMPPHTSEQVHHIHSTVRVVYVLSGRGYSIVGQAGDSTETELLPGMVCVLDPMCPHHFRTEDEQLIVLPVHVWSSTPAGMEQNHPMFNGTKEI